MANRKIHLLSHGKMNNNSKKDKFLLWISIGIALFMFLPMIIAFTYQFIMSLKGVTVHVGNSATFSLFWYSFITIPIGLLAFLILGIGILVNGRNQKK